MTKPISTEMTPTNIASVIEILTATPANLSLLGADFTPEQMRQPLRMGDRSFIEIVAHLVNCEERITESIYAALLLQDPLILDIHPERQWGKLLAYDQFESAELLAYFTFRRKVLLSVLGQLTNAQWERTIREDGKQRKESVYWRARTLALHEQTHIAEIETRFGQIDLKS